MCTVVFFLPFSRSRMISALGTALLLAATCTRCLADGLADCRAALASTDNAPACEQGFQPRTCDPKTPCVAAAYGDYDDFSCAVRAFLDAVPAAYSTRWVQQFHQSRDSNVPPYFYPSASGGSDMTSPDGVNSGPVLFMDIAHGCRTKFDAQGPKCLAHSLSLAHDPSTLRYFWQCSCNVFQHGSAPPADRSAGSLHPESFQGSWEDDDSPDQPNAWARWRPSLMNSGLRMACGGSTPVSCSCEHLQSIWFYKALGFDVGTSFLLGLVENNVEPVCLTRSGSDPSKSPLNDQEFSTDPQPPIAGQAYLYLEEAVVLPSTAPQGSDTLEVVARVPAEASPISRTPSITEPFRIDGLSYFEDDAGKDVLEEQESCDDCGDKFVAIAQQFVNGKWKAGDTWTDACAIGIYVLSQPEADNEKMTRYLKEVVVILAPSNRYESVCNIAPRQSLTSNFAVVQMNASGTVHRAVARLDERLATAEPVSVKELIKAADVRGGTVTDVQVVYDNLGKFILPRVEITVRPTDPTRPIVSRNIPDLSRFLMTAPPLPPDHR